MSGSPVIVLHVGTMKSGTTYLQSRLERNRDRLAADGVLFPGPRWKDQLRAAGDALVRARTEQDLSVGTGRWARMRAQLVGWTGDRAIISVEHLSRANETQARTVVAALEPRAVRVVITVRDLRRAIPSAWQQVLKTGDDKPFSAFLDAVSHPPVPRPLDPEESSSVEPDPAAAVHGTTADTSEETTSEETSRVFWRMHDAAEHVRRWGAAVGADNVTVVTVPPAGSDPDLLWQRFCAAVGLDADRYPTDDYDVVLNPSLGAVGAEVLRRLNERLRRQPDRLDQSAYRDLVRFTVANSTLAGRSGDEPVPMPTTYDDWLLTRSQAVTEGIRASGALVVGDLADLVIAPSAVPGSSPAASTWTMADAAVEAAAELVRRAASGRAGPKRGTRRSILSEQVEAAHRRVERDAVVKDPSDGSDLARPL